MTPAVRRRILLAAAALATYAGACGDTTAEQAAPPPVVHEQDRPNYNYPRPDPPDVVDGLDRTLATTPRAARTRPRPATTPTNTPRRPGTTARVAGGDVWHRLAACESGGNPRAVSPTGTHRGLLQFSLATWRSVGMSGDPIDHTAAEQIAAGRRLQARSGWGSWPACSRKLGLT